MTLEDLLSYAKTEVQNITADDAEFIVRDLFKGYEWKRISRNDRNVLGKMFFDWSKGSGSNIVTPTSKTQQNQQKYKKSN